MLINSSFALAVGLTGYHYYALSQPWGFPFRKNYTEALGMLANARQPSWLIGPSLWLYCALYGVNKEDLTKPLSSFHSFQDFFTRQVKPRQIPLDDKQILAPADSRLLSIAKVEKDDVMQVKKSSYSMCEFFTGKEECKYVEQEIDRLRKNKETQLYSLIFYLSPGDYHRFHAPMDFALTDFHHFKGELKTVSPDYISRVPVW